MRRRWRRFAWWPVWKLGRALYWIATWSGRASGWLCRASNADGHGFYYDFYRWESEEDACLR